MSPSSKIALSVIVSVGMTVAIMSVMSRFPGLEIPRAYWIFGTLCPAVMSFAVSFLFVRQGERVAQLHRELVQAHEELKRASQSDDLTSLLTRNAFIVHVEQLLQTSSGWLLVLDIDHFKSINDRFGHDAGDQALQSVAKVLRGSVRSLDLVGRIGGEEFAIYLPGATAEIAGMIAERMRQLLETMSVDSGDPTPVPVTASIGLSEIARMSSLREGLRKADLAMYRAKADGRNMVRLSA